MQIQIQLPKKLRILALVADNVADTNPAFYVDAEPDPYPDPYPDPAIHATKMSRYLYRR
jgi:hypothetical protein